MAHLVESMVYNGEVPWHGLGVRIPENIRTDAHAVMCAAKLDWTVSPRPAIFMGLDEKLRSINGLYHIVRDSDETPLGVATDRYKVLQNVDGFAVFQKFLDTGYAKIETAGALAGGKIVWALAELSPIDDLIVANDDKIKMYSLLSFTHDVKSSIRIGFTPQRVVCNNTLHMAYANEKSKLIRVLHRGNVIENLKNIVEIMDLLTGEFKATQAQYQKMLNKNISIKDIQNYVKIVFELETEGAKNSRAQNIIDRVVWLSMNGKGNKAVAGTVWAAYNGVTEYLSWEAGRSVDTRLGSLWFGANANLNERAYKEAMRLAA